MPYCNGCGLYQNYVDQRKLCHLCSKLFQEHKLDEKRIFYQRKLVIQSNSYKLLYYPVKLQSIPDLFKHSKIEPVASRSSPLSQFSTIDEGENQTSNSVIPNQNLLSQLFNNPQFGLNQSKIALISVILGFFLSFVSYLSFFGLFLELFALFTIIKAFRTEPRNWQQILALLISLIYWGIIIAGTIIILSNPEILASLEQNINQPST
ncbi:MAG: hypothetical protein K9W44_07425 [Candidatus Lokiarchaeota archaeon]|nr:hypothetical protein [Candidatus Harpocratesius repetitus]